MITVAGDQVAIGDRLFSRRMAGFGAVIAIQGTNAKLRVGTETKYRDLWFTDGGMVQGVKDLSWHEPIALDLPRAKAPKAVVLQELVDHMVARGLV